MICTEFVFKRKEMRISLTLISPEIQQQQQKSSTGHTHPIHLFARIILLTDERIGRNRGVY